MSEKQGHFFKNLIRAEEAAKDIGMSTERLVSYANAQFAPHYMIDGEGPFFRPSEIRSWVRNHLVSRCDGSPPAFTVNVIKQERADYFDVPIELQPMIRHLRKYSGREIPPCVYFLVADERVIYVGKSTTLATRISAHTKEKKFDKVYYMHVPEHELATVEGALIRALKPERNFDAHYPYMDEHVTALARILPEGHHLLPVTERPRLEAVADEGGQSVQSS